MAMVIGVDEAGYGPNLGPLVVTATAWEVPEDRLQGDLYDCFAGVVTRGARGSVTELAIADSKQVYSPAVGLSELERSVLAACWLAGFRGETAGGLCDWVCVSPCVPDEQGPWDMDRSLALPIEVDDREWRAPAERWHGRCAAEGVRLVAIRAEIVSPARFNRLVAREGNKGRVLSLLTMGVLQEVWRGEGEERAMIYGDKHGGRARYGEFLQELAGERFVRTLEERAECSRYRAGGAEFQFAVGSERHFPVALASMTSKYLREISMRLFNAYWCAQVPGLKPTAGYPTDARRFQAAIAARQAELGIESAVLWRER